MSPQQSDKSSKGVYNFEEPYKTLEDHVYKLRLNMVQKQGKDRDKHYNLRAEKGTQVNQE